MITWLFVEETEKGKKVEQLFVTRERELIYGSRGKGRPGKNVRRNRLLLRDSKGTTRDRVPENSTERRVGSFERCESC